MKRCMKLLIALCLAMAAGGSPCGLLAQVTSYPRGASDAAKYLGDVHQDQANGFSIRPPAQWWLDAKNPRFAVMFADRGYQAYVIVDVVKIPGDARMDRDFLKFIAEKNKEVKEMIPSFSVLSNRTARLGRGTAAYRTEATFQAGPNTVLMNIYYVSGKSKVFMITTVCPEATARTWEPLFQACLATFTPLD
ncbi:MAG TPA: hypothetical protein VM658_00190 [bacterium]|nr:hypothetical protein [bacterium]